MSMHKKPMSQLEISGLVEHGLKTNEPSQLSDCFRAGIKFSENHYAELLRTAEQELDQYKADLAECSRLIEQMQAAEHQKHLELESLRVEIERLVSFNDKLIESERKLINDNLSLRTKIREAKEQSPMIFIKPDTAEYINAISPSVSARFSMSFRTDSAVDEFSFPLYAAPVIPD